VFKDRWMMPLCVWLPVLLVVVLAPRLNPTRVKRLLAIAGTIGVIVSILIPTRVWYASQFKIAHRSLTRTEKALHAPYQELARDLNRLLPAGGFIVADEDWIGGNLKLYFPRRWVVSSHFLLQLPLRSGDKCLLVWEAAEQAPPAEFLKFTRQFADVDVNEIRYVEAPLKSFQTHRMRFGIALGTVNSNRP
jgi:hypothetical protein